MARARGEAMGFGYDEALVGIMMWVIIIWFIDETLGWSYLENTMFQIFILVASFIVFLIALLTED